MRHAPEAQLCLDLGHARQVDPRMTEKLDPDALAAGASRVARTDVQRLGWLLDFVEQPDLANALAATVAGKRLLPTPLTGARESANVSLDPRWHVLVNDDMEPDL